MLAAGQAAVVMEIVGTPEQVVRMEELGMRSGRIVEMLQPGSPCIVRLEGNTKLCFRDNDALGVLVQPQGES